MKKLAGFARRCHRALIAGPLLLGLAAASPAQAGVVVEGTYTISAPDPAVIDFRMVLTPTGARIVPSQGETIVISYAEASALLVDHPSRSYVPLPLELVPPLIAGGIGYDPAALGATASGRTRRLLGQECGEVLVSGGRPKVSLRAWRIADPAWGKEYSLFERALGMPWTTANPPPLFVGIPLSGSIEIEGRRPYRASWEITKFRRDDQAAEDFAVPEGYQMDLARLLTLQGGRR